MSHLQPSTLLQGGKYKIIRFISAGGFGCTYEGVHTMLDTRIAIKEFFVKDFCNRDEQTSHITVGTQSKVELVQKLRRKFIDEAKALYKMQHPNIVRVLDIFEENGTAYYVMDYIDGQSLHEIVKERGALPEQEVLGYVEQIANALKYVHGQNRLHLDIKPGNIMVDKLGKVKLIDFGASKQYDEVNGENTSTLVGKTPGYAPIEQMGNTVRTFTPATDIYALGATMYKCLTGNTPPDANMLIAKEETLAPIPSEISIATRNAVLKAMTLIRADRPQTVEAFLSMLDSKITTTSDDEVTVVEVEDSVKQRSPKLKFEDLTFNVDGVSFKMIAVEGGTFKMGGCDSDSYENEEPIHDVTLSSYFIGETQVTQNLWKAVMGSNPSHFKGDNLPVECVSWNNCQKFISKLNSMTGQNFRLPTEAEWEHAARGGQKSRGYKYSGSNNIDEVAWYDDNSHTRVGWFGIKKDQQPHPIATKKANELGIYDMSGNVWEWCQDWYGNYSSSSQTNPSGPNSGVGRVCRGGFFFNFAWECRSSRRHYGAPSSSYNSIGFRLVLVP